MARFEITSLAFMLVDVPEPVWKTSTTNWSFSLPSATSCAARTIASATSGSSSPRSRLASAAASLIWPRARMKDGGNRRSLIGKLSTALIVWAP